MYDVTLIASDGRVFSSRQDRRHAHQALLAAEMQMVADCQRDGERVPSSWRPQILAADPDRQRS